MISAFQNPFSKKAQVGKILATLPVLILVVIIMGLYLTLSTIITNLHKPDFEPASNVNLQENNLLLQTIEIEHELNGGDIAIEKMLVLDAKALQIKGEIREDVLTKHLQSLLNEEQNCYILYDEAYEESTILTSTKGYKYTPVKPNELHELNFQEIKNHLIYEEALESSNINLGSERQIKHYFGKCLK